MRKTGLTLALGALVALAACGKGANTTADSVAADTSRLSPNVGEMKPQNDSALAAGKARIDSLKQAGETPASGIAKGIQPVGSATANDSSPGARRLTVDPPKRP